MALRCGQHVHDEGRKCPNHTHSDERYVAVLDQHGHATFFSVARLPRLLLKLWRSLDELHCIGALLCWRIYST